MDTTIADLQKKKIAYNVYFHIKCASTVPPLSSGFVQTGRNSLDYRVWIIEIMIHQIFLPICNWPKCSTCPNIPQLKLGDIQEYQPNEIPQCSNLESIMIQCKPSFKIFNQIRECLWLLQKKEDIIFFIKFVPAENTPKNTSHPAYGKLFVNIFHVHGKILEG